jgi:plastocyanin
MLRILPVAIALLVAACGPGAAASEPEPAPAAAGNEVAVTVTARDIWFEPTLVQVPAGRALAIALENRDAGVPHDIALMADASFTTKLGASEIVTGPAMAVLRVPGLVAGNYRLVCEVHPVMTVDLEVRP